MPEEHENLKDIFRAAVALTSNVNTNRVPSARTGLSTFFNTEARNVNDRARSRERRFHRSELFPGLEWSKVFLRSQTSP